MEIIHNLSLLCFAGAAVYPLSKFAVRRVHARARNIAIGITMGAVALLLSSVPLVFPGDVVVDGRAGPMLFAGFLGGPVGALVAAAIGCIARVFQVQAASERGKPAHASVTG